MAVHASTDAALESPRARTSDGRRTDIQVLRAVAVLGVVAYHLWPRVLHGGFIGVDVFFVISGFLVGGALAREVMDTGRIQFAEFYARRVRRIAPLAAVVGIVTTIACAALFSPLDLMLWGQPWDSPSAMKDAIAVAVSLPNLWFGISQHGYVNADVISPFTQYWSLGVEEQFYLVAPLAFVALWAAARRGRSAFLLTLGVVIVGSFDYALVRNYGGSFDAFFDPIARIWELAIGALVAIAGSSGRRWFEKLRCPTLAGVCLLVIAASMATIGSTVNWPRTTALLPVLATAGVLWCGSGPRGAPRLRGAAPWVWIGDRSFSLYLWHFPLLVLVPEFLGRALVGWEPFGVVAAAITLSAVSYHRVELPFRRLPVHTSQDRRRIFAAGVGLFAVAIAAGVGVGVRASTSSLVSDRMAQRYEPHRLVGSQQPFQVSVPVNVRPSLITASHDLPTNTEDGCDADPYVHRRELRECAYGTSGPNVVLYGDSHAAQWFDALAVRAELGDYTLTPLTADGCLPMSLDRKINIEACDRFRQDALAIIERLSADVTVISSRTTYSDLAESGTAAEIYPEAIASMLTGLPRATRVVWIADGPTLPSDLTRCAASTPNDIRDCTADPETALPSAANAAIRAVVEDHGGLFVDMNSYLCSETDCGVIVDDILMYRDDDHISATFSRALASALLAELEPVLREAPNDSTTVSGTNPAPDASS